MKRGLGIFAIIGLLFLNLAFAEDNCSPSLLGSSIQPAKSSEGLIRVLSHGKYGYIDIYNKLVIPAKYEAADDFYDGLASVKENGKWEVINSRGKVLHPWMLTTVQPSRWIGPIQLITPNLESQGRTIDARFLAYPENRNNEIFKELEALRSDPSSELLPAKLSGRWGYVDRRISLDHPEESLAILPQFEDAKPFSDGLAPAKLNGKWGYINLSGQFVIQPIYDQAEPFDHNLALVLKGRQLSNIDLTGKSLYSCEMKKPHLQAASNHPVIEMEALWAPTPSGIVMGAPEKE